MSSYDYVAQANAILGGLYESCDHNGSHIFGSHMLSGDDNSIITTCVIHRILNKFQEPVSMHEHFLKKKCNADWIEYEEQLHSWNLYNSGAQERSIIYRARALLHKWFRNWKPANVIEFTPGETFVSNKGKVSIYQKLKTRSNWCVTHDACDDFISLCYRTPSLKRCAKKHMHALTAEQAGRLYKVFKNDPRGVGYASFHFRMKLDVLTIVHGSRASSVEKDNEKRRFINVEPLCNMILQRADAHAIRQVLEAVGNSLDDGQQRHREMIAHTGRSTIDFSNASDSVIRRVCELMFPRSVFKTLDRHRSPFVLIEGVYYSPIKMSSMGNGFTFELMSCLLLAIGRVLDATASVYGDDVIIGDTHAVQFVSTAQAIGFRVNEKKTFIQSRFRESCGAFYLDGHGYITCYDIKWCHTLGDVITSCNKLGRIVRAHGDVLPAYFRDAHAALLALCPIFVKGPDLDVIVGEGDLPTFVMDPSYKRKHMRDKRARSFYQLMCDKLGTNAFKHLCYEMTDVVFVKLPHFVEELATPFNKGICKNVFEYSASIYAGMRWKDTVRNKGKWSLKTYVLFPNGNLIPVRYFTELAGHHEGQMAHIGKPIVG